MGVNVLLTKSIVGSLQFFGGWEHGKVKHSKQHPHKFISPEIVNNYIKMSRAWHSSALACFHIAKLSSSRLV